MVAHIPISLLCSALLCSLSTLRTYIYNYVTLAIVMNSTENNEQKTPELQFDQTPVVATSQNGEDSALVSTVKTQESGGISADQCPHDQPQPQHSESSSSGIPSASPQYNNEADDTPALSIKCDFPPTSLSSSTSTSSRCIRPSWTVHGTCPIIREPVDVRSGRAVRPHTSARLDRTFASS